MRDFLKKGLKIELFFLFVFLATLVVGCDRIPFLSDSFSGKTKKPQLTEEPTEVKGTVLAKVDNWVITQEEFNQKIDALKELSPEFKFDTFETKSELLDELIRQELLVSEARLRGLDKKKEIIDATEEFNRGLLVRELVNNFTKDIDVGSQEVEDYYKQFKDSFKEPTQWHIREIVVSDSEQAKNILIELLRGADFATTAMQYSKSSSASKGGDLGFADQPKFPQLETALNSLEAGAISNVIKGPDGYYIVKLEEKKGGKEKTLSEVWDEIKEGLTFLKQNQRLQDYIAKLKQDKKIEINDYLLR